MCTGLHKIHLSSPYQTTTICSQTMKFNNFPKMLSFVNPVLEAIKMAMASVASIALLGFAGLTLAGSTVGLVVATPLFIIFSPILVPATIATTLLATGLTAGASLGGMALGLIIWLIKSSASYKGGKRPSAQTLLPFFGTFADKPAAGATPPAAGATPPAAGATPPAGGAAPPASGGATPAGGRVIPAILGSVKWTWTRDGNPFSGGWFGGTPADGGESVGASSPGVVLQWSWTSLRGKKYSGKLPFAVIPTGGGKPAAAPSAE